MYYMLEIDIQSILCYLQQRDVEIIELEQFDLITKFQFIRHFEVYVCTYVYNIYLTSM